MRLSAYRIRQALIEVDQTVGERVAPSLKMTRNALLTASKQIEAKLAALEALADAQQAEFTAPARTPSPTRRQLGPIGQFADALAARAATLADQFAVFSITPNTGREGAGTAVTIKGVGFTGATGVTIGGQAVTGVVVKSDQIITGVAPAGSAGAEDVVVTVGGDTATLADGYTFAALPPLPVSALEATVVSDTEIDLAWSDNSTDETGFSVERSLDGETGWTEVGTPAANAEAFSDTSLTAETEYFYRVFAVNAAGSSPASAVVSATTEAAP